jgi:hypothetical protein
MNPQNPYGYTSAPPSNPPDAVDDTLRLIASLPVPAGLEDRIVVGLRSSRRMQPHGARILAWPLRPGRAWAHSAALRTAAAAAIVLAVAGGGWGVYSYVQSNQPRAVAQPPRPAVSSGGFSNAGAMRTPQTLNGPVLTHPLEAPQPPAKAPARAAQKLNHRGQATAAAKAASELSAPAGK